MIPFEGPGEQEPGNVQAGGHTKVPGESLAQGGRGRPVHCPHPVPKSLALCISSIWLFLTYARAMEHCDDTVMEHCDDKNYGAL